MVKRYGALNAWSSTAIVLIVFMFPFGIQVWTNISCVFMLKYLMVLGVSSSVCSDMVQASALLAENVVYPLLVLGTLTTHIENFSLELDQYLTVLAINHGSLARHATHNYLVDEDSRVHDSKVCDWTYISCFTFVCFWIFVVFAMSLLKEPLTLLHFSRLL